jgi:hypothetical protein
MVSATTITVQPGQSIQEAINNLPTDGGVIELGVGVHDVYDAIVINKNNVTIQGTHNSEIRSHDSNQDIFVLHHKNPSKSDPWNSLPLLENIVLKGFKVTSTFSVYTRENALFNVWKAKNITMEDILNDCYCTFISIDADASQPAKAEDIYIRNNTINNACIVSRGCDNIWITNNRLVGGKSELHGIHMDYGLSQDIHIIGNYVENTAPNGNIKTESSYAEIRDNVCIGTYVGIKVNVHAQHVVVDNNTVIGATEAGIEVKPQQDMIDIIIKNNRIYNNNAPGFWYYWYDYGYNPDVIKLTHVDLINNVIYNNAGDGIETVCPYGSLTVINNIITNNKGFGINNAGGIDISHSYNDIWANTQGKYSGTTAGIGEMETDPLFANPTTGDFHIKSTAGRWTPAGWVTDSVMSPCIDAGDPSSDYSKEPSPNGARINMGAYGNTKEASKSGGPDTTPPTIIAHSPKGTSVSVGTQISVTFSKAMNQFSAQSAFSISPSVPGTFSWNGNQMVFTPSLNLAYLTTYTITIGTGAKDLAGNLLKSPYSWSFTTVPLGTCYTYKLVNPGESIQAALDGLCTSGGTIELGNGEHVVSSTIHVNRSNIVIGGQSYNAVVRHTVPNTRCFDVSDTPNQLHDITFRGFTVESTYTSSNSEIIGYRDVTNLTVRDMRSNDYSHNFVGGYGPDIGDTPTNYYITFFNNTCLHANLQIYYVLDNFNISHNIISGGTYGININRNNANGIIHDNIVSGQTTFSIRAHGADTISIYNNTCSGSTAGIHDDGLDNALVYNNTFSESSTAGIWINPQGADFNKTYRNNIIHNCQSPGILVTNYASGKYGVGSDATFANNVIYNNTDGVRFNSANVPVDLVNNIISNNSYYGINNILGHASTVIRYNDVWGNVLGNYNGITAGLGDVALDPKFADSTNLDFHLKSTAGRWKSSGWVTDSVISPCIDSGDPSSNYSNEPSPNGGRINMGAYGNTKEASKSPGGGDTIPPTTTAANGPELVTFFRSDTGGSGISYTNYSKVSETGPWTTVTSATAAGSDAGNVTDISESKFNVTISGEGITEIWFYSVDNSNNVEPTKNITVEIGTIPPEEGDVILWDTNHVYDWKFYDFVAFADKDDWTQVPYGIIDYIFTGDAVIENEQYYLFLHSNPDDCPFLYPKRDSSYGSVNEIYNKGGGEYGHGTINKTILKNTPDDITIEHAGEGGSTGNPLITSYRIPKNPWLEIKPVSRVNQLGMHDKSRLATFLFPNVDNDIILDANKHGDFIETINPAEGCMGEINFHRASNLGADYDFMWFLTFPPGIETSPLTYQTLDSPDCYWEWDCRCCVPRSVSQNFAYLGDRGVIISVLNFKDNWKREDVGQYLNTSEIYTSLFTAPYAGKWHVFGVMSDDDYYITNYSNEAIVNSGDHFTFTSPVSGTLDYLVIYMFDRTENTPANITTPMDVYRETIARGELVAEWKFDEGSGNIAYDSSGKINNGTLINNPTRVDGKLGKALSFDGINDYIEIASSPSLNSITTQITILAWVKTDFAQRGTIIDNWFYDRTVTPQIGERAYVFTALSGADAGKFDFGLSPQGDGSGLIWLTSNTAVPSNQWTHVAFVSNGTITAIYLNGNLDASTSAPNQIHVSNRPIHIGAWNAKEVGYPEFSTFFNGVLDEVKIYNRALSAEEILADYETAPSSETGAVSGRITYTNNGTGIADVTVNLSQGGSVIASTTTDSSGNYLITGLPPGAYTLTVSKLRFWSNSTSVTVTADETETVNRALWLKGDLNNNGVAADDAGDIAMMGDASVGKITPDWRYDLNTNGDLADAGDQAMLKDASVGKIELV